MSVNYWGNTDIQTGVYTPTITEVQNLDSTTAQTCRFSKIGNQVTVFGSFLADATTAGNLTILKLSLPIYPGDLSSSNQLVGVGSNDDGTVCRINTSTSDDLAQVTFRPDLAVNLFYTFSFNYEIL